MLGEDRAFILELKCPFVALPFDNVEDNCVW